MDIACGKIRETEVREGDGERVEVFAALSVKIVPDKNPRFGLVHISDDLGE